MRWSVLPLVAALVAPFSSVASAAPPERKLTLPETPYRYANPKLPPNFEERWVKALDTTPADNPTTDAGATLGRVLFYDTRLSGDGTYSCGTCHEQALAFTDGLANALGSTGEVHRRGSMSLANVAYNSVLTWANPLMRTLEDQALVPMFGEHPVELGLAGKEDELLSRLEADALYQQLFAVAFPQEAAPISLNSIVKSIAAFERTLISGNSDYDRYFYQGQSTALSEGAKRGMLAFFSEKLECYHCHGTFNFMDSVVVEGSAFEEIFFHNTGLYNVCLLYTSPSPRD